MFYLHIGPAKTGTSAVQHVLSRQPDSGIIYPPVGLWADGSHHNLVFNFFEDYHRPETSRVAASILLDQIGALAAASPDRNLVISSETLAGRDVAAFAQAVLSYLPRQDLPVCVIVVCREHFERAASMYNQAVKDAVWMERRLPGDYLVASHASILYARLIEPLRASGLTVQVLNYHPAASFVGRFLRHVGCDVRVDLPSDRRNVSLSVKGLIATLAANQVAQTSAERQACFEAMRRMKRFFAPSQFIFDRVAAAAAAPAFTADRAYLAREFGVVLPDPDPLSQVNALALNPAELAEIGVAVQGLGETGEAILEFAGRFVAREGKEGLLF